MTAVNDEKECSEFKSVQKLASDSTEILRKDGKLKVTGCRFSNDSEALHEYSVTEQRTIHLKNIFKWVKLLRSLEINSNQFLFALSAFFSTDNIHAHVATNRADALA